MFGFLIAIVPGLARANSAEELSYYSQHGALSAPGERTPLLASLPEGPAATAKALQGLVLHGGLCWLYKVQPREEQIAGFKYHRGTALLLEQLSLLGPGPLSAERSLDKRLIGNCRTFALLAVSALRQQGIPARMRVGYSTYTSGPEKFDNHFVCEYWNGERWVLLDAQIDEAQRKLHGLDFDTLDLPAGKFVFAGEVWQRLKKGQIDPASIGTNGPKGWEGLGWAMVQADLIADAWALSKVELITGETNALGRKPHEQWSKKEIKLLDELARLSTGPEAGLPKLRKKMVSENALQIDLKAWKP